MLDLLRQGWNWSVVTLAAVVLAGCASSSRTPAPVEDRNAARAPAAAPAAAQAAPVVTELPRLAGADNAGKPGYYSVRPGDTVIRIALESGQNWRDIARWNNLDNPNLIEVGQVLRIAPPAGSAAEVAVGRPVPPASAAAATPLPAASAPRTTATAAVPAPAATPAAPAAAGAPPAVAGDDDVPWAWPTPGNATVLAGFDEVKNKGLDIAGKAGDPVLAAADGRVVYAGAGLRGYGNLIILKHNNTYLTAYAHNQALLVKEDQSVRKGQKIAEMGNSDADRVKLHFEIRRQGKPVDPARFLPAR